MRSVGGTIGRKDTTFFLMTSFFFIFFNNIQAWGCPERLEKPDFHKRLSKKVFSAIA
jgi:hypothetical protein